MLALFLALTLTQAAPAAAPSRPDAPAAVAAPAASAPVATPAAAAPSAAEQEAIRAAGLTDAMVQKLTGEQLHDVLRHQLPAHVPDPPAVAVVAVIGFFMAVIAVVLALLYAIFRTHRSRHETIRLMVEKGAPIPKELLSQTRAPNDLRRGILLSALGVGLAVFLAAVSKEHDKGAWTLGLVPFLLGVGYIISAKLVKSQAQGAAQHPAQPT